ncbi:MAG: hypothetical protein MIO90_05775, partial [Methanomassiliicoccales archaeon]|nr:hypothetical protein [Methanomassiliicoccales archaeon]
LPVRSRPSIEGVGNKVLNTQLMMRYGLRVPKSWAIPFWLGETYFRDRSEALELLESSLERLVGSDLLFAVRSSAEGEDDSKRSFAGQFTSVLNVPGNKLVESVEKVWASLATQRLEGYSESPRRMGVLLQVMVPSEVAGVSFSCDPLSGRRVAVVEAVKGEGSRLVQDGQTPWRYEMTVDLVKLTGEGDLDPAVLDDVVRTTFWLRKRTGKDLDLEWVFDGRKLYWVQMRSLTGLKGLDRYTNTFSQEFLPGMIKPLVWSVNVPINSHAWVRLLSELTGRKDLSAENLAKSFYYRAYFNMGEFGKVWQAMGMPDDLLEQMVLMRGDGKMRFRPNPKLMLTVPRIARFLWSKRRWFSEVDGALLELRQAFERRAHERLDRLSDDELMQRVDGLLQEGVRSAYYTVLCIMSSSLVTRVWKRYLERRGMDWQSMSLSTGEDGGYPEERLRELRDLLCGAEQDLTYERLCQSPRHDLACRSFQAFLKEYGHYSESGNDFSVPPWREDPDLVLDIVRKVPQRERSKG